MSARRRTLGVQSQNRLVLQMLLKLCLVMTSLHLLLRRDLMLIPYLNSIVSLIPMSWDTNESGEGCADAAMVDED